MSERETIRVKETDLILLRVNHLDDSHDLMAQRLHEETGALVIITEDPHFKVDTLAEDAARHMFDVLKRRFEEA